MRLTTQSRLPLLVCAFICVSSAVFAPKIIDGTYTTTQEWTTEEMFESGGYTW